ncbi:DUF6445 family protein [Lacimicrobium alkaliphilum]|uniref:Uncharacterized protein n=1 Tax=Lacimicrobium alkaliphilum TaxID=1526571 RepID=A0A0U2ZLN4_9ALTE|nr:DUF6445 family protein [Lacimicrobium alkaliphilum]ALS99895.1 hypothetical protein AT746_17570 [Lacimicrobium alkaliphilum]
MLSTHKNMQIQSLHIGKEQAPLLVVDNFVDQSQWLVEQACKEHLVANSPYYPGIRAAAPARYRQLLLQSLESTLIDAFGLPANSLSFSVCHFSVVTTPPQQLKLLQRIPHFDTPERDALAAVHYLFEGDQGGTAFYRHRKTGFETIDKGRAPEYFRSLEAENNGPNLPKASEGYISGDTPLFEKIAEQQGVFNRLIVYRRHSLHSGAIPANASLSADPRQGRLTISSFIDCC